jgi:PBSX family phage terminase large subunit
VATKWAGLTPKQTEANKLLAGPQRHTMLYGGSRSGKTFLLCRAMAVRALRAPKSRHVIARLRFNAVKVSVGFDTMPKVLDLCFPGVRAPLNKSDWFFEFPNGSQIWLAGLDEKERVEKILGQEHATGWINEASQFKTYSSIEVLQTRIAQKVECSDGRPLINRMWYDCNPPGRGHWSYKVFVQKIKPGSKRDLFRA